MKRSLARLAEAELLDTRLCDLDVELQGTWLEDCVADLYANLARRALAFRPHVWLSSDWFSPTGVPGIAIPFYLAHPRLMKLERAQMLECALQRVMADLEHLSGQADSNEVMARLLREFDVVTGLSAWSDPLKVH